MDGKEVLCLRDQVIPLLHLHEVLHLPPSRKDNPWVYVVLVALAEKRVGLIVEDLLHQEEVVIKPLGRMLQGTAGMAGATIAGDGRIALILDIPSLLKRYARRM